MNAAAQTEMDWPLPDRTGHPEGAAFYRKVLALRRAGLQVYRAGSRGVRVNGAVLSHTQFHFFYRLYSAAHPREEEE